MATPGSTFTRRQLLNHVVDRRAKDTPDSVYAEYPISTTGYDEGFLQVTYADFANVINGLAWWLHNTIGPGINFETLAYIGPLDIRYNALLLGAVKAGYKVLLTSPRNSLPAHVNLFNLLSCKKLVAPNPAPQAVTTIVASHDIEVLEIPSVADLLTQVHPQYAYKKSFDEARKDPLVVLHTSGTTGLPKPIIWTHEFADSWLHWVSLDAPAAFNNQHSLWSPGRLFFLFPPFHAASMFGSILGAIFRETTIIFPPAGLIPSAQVLVDGLKYTHATCAAIVPLVAEELSNKPDLLDFVSQKLPSMFYSGGTLSQTVGDKISEKMKFFSIIGTTETGLFPTIYPADQWPTAEWKHFQFNPDYRFEFQNASEGEYEAVIARHPDGDKEQPVFKVFPDLKEYRTGDLYIPHPSKPNLWQYRGRGDDIIVFLTGEKTNPTTMEQMISSHPKVKSVLVLGSMRFQAALLVEPQDAEALSVAERADFIEEIWPTIQAANIDCPRHAQIKKSHIMFIKPDKPMLRSAKGTIQRRPTLNLYEKEIEELYADAEKVSALDVEDLDMSTLSIDCKDYDAVASFLTETLSNFMDSKTFTEDENFFLSGVDSLQALQMTRRLKAMLALPDLEISTVYANPTIKLLTKAILSLAEEGNATDSLEQSSRIDIVETTINKYTALIEDVAQNGTGIPLSKHDSGIGIHDERVVLLTGSTGGIGCYMLQALLSDSSVAHIFCLNRAENPEALQRARSSARGLPTNFPAHRVTFLTTDLAKPQLGLGDEDYSRLQDTATNIIHNAWPVNFNLTLPTFEPHLEGVVNLVKLAAATPGRAHVTFISSVSSVMGSSQNPIAEGIITDASAPLPMGYGQSKYVAERILGYVESKIANVDVTVVRVGQVAGPAFAPGSWNKWEWFPSLVVSSLHLGMIPDSLGKGRNNHIDWVPIDVLAHTLVEFSLPETREKRRVSVLHPQNPRPTSWDGLRPIVVKALNDAMKTKGRAEEIQEVALSTWIERVRRDAASIDTAGKLQDMLQFNPAAKLLDFYQGLLVGDEMSAMDGDRALQASKTLKGLDEIQADWVERWVHDWVKA
ncbi:hypothetical protein PV08_06465 [Exophiala spinifera]|uniref:Carrier domain-containing protein n=1 Tax=Exophiala spinifera TaxID=91928 RepID=A0A0D2BBM4_9EURO|nr:uncharacterized protein PV08_06465 [Exophiala spinifera]KIW16413.1 hypothetical protein PV08_06465 [Exophiala spinifera]